jgi:uncharacterized protein (TIGR02996 family)
VNEDVGLLSDILDHPHDDTPRLIYADWLEDRAAPGDAPRAAFIRLQIDIARGGSPALLRREKAMLAQYGRTWSREMRPRLSRLVWRRGFVETATVSTAEFLAAPDEILALAPLRRLRFRDPGDHLGTLCRCPHLARLEGISFAQGRLSRDHLPMLATSPHLGALRELDLGGNRVGWCGRLLALLNHLPALDTLGLSAFGLGGGGLAWILPAWFRDGRLVSLDLEANGLDDSCVERFQDLSLRRLAVGRNRFSADGLNRLVEVLPRLEMLSAGVQPRAVREQLTKDYPSVTFEFGHAVGMGA